MKRLAALLVTVLFVMSFAGCTPQQETTVNTAPDLSWWEENISNTVTGVSVGNSGASGAVDAADILQLMKQVKFGTQTDIIPLGGYDNAAHSISLSDLDGNKWITYRFYEDFTYVSYAGSDGPENTDTLYWLENSDEIKQFFIDNGHYMPLHIRTDIIDSLAVRFESGDMDFINSVAQQTGADGSVTTIPEGGEIEYLNIYNVAPYYFGGQTQKYSAFAEIILEYDDRQKCYIANISLDEIYNPTKAFIHENKALANWARQYMIADVDYSMWMRKLDNPQYNGFHYWLYSGNSGHAESSMEWAGAIMNCIKNLSLGEQVSIDTKAYPRRQVYKIVLNEDNGNYNENPVILGFYDDCRYVAICNCKEENSQASDVCSNHTTAYKVNNPQSVIDIFSMDGQYVSPRDYESLEKFAQEYMESTSTATLNETAGGDRKIVESYNFTARIANFTAENTDHLSAENGREDFRIDYTAMFVKTDANNHNSYISYNFRAAVYKTASGWEMQSIHIY